MMSSSPKLIDRYIAATRQHQVRRVRLEFYQTTIQRLEWFSGQLGIPIKVTVVYSSGRRVEQVKLAEVTWLIYDQYMGQSMNLLNRIFIEADDTKPTIAYAHKVLSEHFVEVGLLGEALHCATIYDSFREHLSAKHIDEPWRGILTYIHERFLLYHEFGHCTFADQTKLPVMREHVRELIDHQKELKNKTYEEALALLHAAPPIAYHNVSLDEAIRDLQKHYQSSDGREFTAAMVNALDEAEIEEEIFSDIFAADYTAHEAKLDNVEKVQTLRAIYIGFYHLQALEYLRRLSTPKKDKTWLTENMPRIQARSHCLRAHLIFLYQIELQYKQGLGDDLVAQRIRDFESELMHDQKRYYDVIYDCVTSICDGLGKDNLIGTYGVEALGELKENIGNHQLFEQLTDEKLRKIILALTGWLH